MLHAGVDQIHFGGFLVESEEKENRFTMFSSFTSSQIIIERQEPLEIMESRQGEKKKMMKQKHFPGKGRKKKCKKNRHQEAN